MYRIGKWTELWGLSRPAFAMLGMILVLILLSSITVWRTAKEANRVDYERTAIAVRNAVAGEAAELLAIAADNAQWDDAAAIAYDGADSRAFAAENYIDASADGQLYDGVVALRRDGHVVINLRQGVPESRVPHRWVGAEIDHLMTLAAANRTAFGLIHGDDGIRLVGMAMVEPTSEARRAAFQAQQPEPVFMLFTRPLNQSTLSLIGSNLVLDGVTLGDDQHNRHAADEGVSNHAHSSAHIGPHEFTILRDVGGRAIASVCWRPNSPGNQAIARSVPFIALTMFLALFASALLLRRGYASVSEISRIALLDTLSELPNRRALRKLTRHALRQYSEVAIAFIDIDGFKTVNDLYGHDVGDQLIVQIARILADIAPSPGGSARLGGDEFALVSFAEGANDRLEAAADALLDKLRQPFRIGDRTIMVGASIGLSNRDTAGDNAAEMMREADVAMYVAKSGGKMRRVWFEPAHDQDRTAALKMETQLRQALDDDAFEVVYQPLIDARNGDVSGFEALLRWRDQGPTVIGPDAFIPIAEATGLIDRLGEFVLRQACTDAHDWDNCSLSINVSVAQLRNPNYVQQLSAILAETDFPAERLIIDITEKYVVAEPHAAREVIDAVRALGVRVALDDFGTGYASIGFLRQFAFDVLKIDRMLVADAMGDAAARTMLHSSIALARALAMTTVAEGIENEAQAIVMRAAGCDLLQGWHFARESDADTSAAMVNTATLSRQRA